MYFKCKVKIDSPRTKVVEMFSDPENLRHWQDGFISKTLLFGEEFQEGSISQMLYEFGKKDMAIKETILSNKLPDYFEGLYEHEHTTNTMKSHFKELDQNSTLYEAEVEYTKLQGIMVRLIAFIAPSLFRKQVQKWMDQFKEYVENN